MSTEAANAEFEHSLELIKAHGNAQLAQKLASAAQVEGGFSRVRQLIYGVIAQLRDAKALSRTAAVAEADRMTAVLVHAAPLPLFPLPACLPVCLLDCVSRISPCLPASLPRCHPPSPLFY